MEKGPELVLIYMGYTFLVVTAIFLAVVFLSDVGMSHSTMIPPIYFAVLAALCWGIAIGLRNNEFDLKRFKDWLFGFIFLGVFIGIVFGSYMW